MSLGFARKQAYSTLLALLFGVAAFFYSERYLHAHTDEPIANDYTYHWLAGRALIEGRNPYATIQPGGPHNLNAGYLYPLPDAIVAVPFAFLEPIDAAAAFTAVSVFLLVFGISLSGYGRLAMLAGIPFLWATAAGQPSPIVTASVLVPGIGWLGILKPNLALALIAYKPSKSLVIGAVVLIAISFTVLPAWPLEWLAAVKARTPGNYGTPLLQFGGPIVLLSLLRWKRPEARLLLVMALVPQSLLFYDQLPLALVAKNRTESMLLVITGFVGFVVASMILPAYPSTPAVSRIYGPAIVASLYLPSVIMVLLRKNERELPAVV